jgi:hypothetical protein
MKFLFMFIPLVLISSFAHASGICGPNCYQSPNMGLAVPIPGLETGPAWANDINASLTLLDAHDHSSGKGVPVTPSGLNINSNLSMHGNSLSSLGGGFFLAQSVDPTSNASIYSKGVDLYYKDGNGNVIQITAGGGVNGSPGSISNLTSPASASYISATSTFQWLSGATTSANMDAASYVLRYPGSYPNPSGNYIAIEAPSSLATGYALTLPATTPANDSFVQMSTGGVLSASVAVNSGINTSNLANGAVTPVKKAALGQQISAGSSIVSTTSLSPVTINNLSVSLVSTGRPVFVGMQTVANGNGNIQVFGSGVTGLISFYGGTAGISSLMTGSVGIISTSGNSVTIPCSSFWYIDLPPAQTNLYIAKYNSASIGGTIQVSNCVLVAYEL